MYLGFSGREACAAAPAKVRGLDLVDDAIRLHLKRLLHSLVAVEFQVAVDVRSAFTKAL
jgi:hypothetical protein